jgi:outer membrane immunogenic protein
MKYFAAIMLIATSLGVGVAQAQSPASSSFIPWVVEAGAGFAAVRANASPGVCGCFFMYGVNAQAAVVNHTGFGLLADYGRTSASNINGGGHDLTLSTYMGGVRYSPLMENKLSPYGQVLVGLGHTSSNYAIDADANRFAAAVGGGLNIALSSRWDLRVVEAEYLLTRIPNAANEIQNQLRLSTGLVYRFTKR